MKRRRAIGQSRWGISVGCALIIGIVAGACGSSTPTGPSPTRQPSMTRDEAISILAEAGIEVVADYGSTTPLKTAITPVSLLRYTAFQAGNLARDFAASGGVLGADLDEIGALVGIPTDAPPFSSLIAAWVKSFDSTGAASARRLMGPHEWAHSSSIIYPHLVLAMFIADLVRPAPSAARLEAPAAGIGPDSRGAMPMQLAAVVPVGGGVGPQAADTVCAGVSGWVNSVLRTMFDFLKLGDSGSSVINAIAFVWNAAVELLQDIVTGLITKFTDLIFAALRTAIAAVAALSMAASLFVPYAISWQADPVSIHLSHPGEGEHTGTLTATLLDTDVQWAAEILACAKLAGVDLPDPRAPGKTIAWSLSTAGKQGALIKNSMATIGADGRASLTFGVGAEPGTGDIKANLVYVKVDVEHLSDAQFKDMLLTTTLGGDAGHLLADVLGGQISKVTGKIASLMNQTSGGPAFEVEYHDPSPTPTPTETPSPTPSETPGPAATVYFPATITLEYAHGFGIKLLTNGWCKSGPEEGGYWQLWFVKPNGEEFDIALFEASKDGLYTFDEDTVTPFAISSLALMKNNELWKVNVRLESLSLFDVGTAPPGSPVYTGPVSGSFRGSIHEDEDNHDISGDFRCFPAAPNPT